ncbi:hypothetical protein D3C80_1644580 [compost metagenome]
MGNTKVGSLAGFQRAVIIKAEGAGEWPLAACTDIDTVLRYELPGEGLHVSSIRVWRKCFHPAIYFGRRL